MSRNHLCCHKCTRPLAVKSHRGRIVVESGVPVAILPEGVELTCKCGERRVIEVRPQERAA